MNIAVGDRDPSQPEEAIAGAGRADGGRPPSGHLCDLEVRDRTRRTASIAPAAWHLLVGKHRGAGIEYDVVLDRSAVEHRSPVADHDVAADGAGCTQALATTAKRFPTTPGLM